jgi:hypothetical protein
MGRKFRLLSISVSSGRFEALVFPNESVFRLFGVPVLSGFPAFSEVPNVDVPAFPDMSEFSIASTLLVGIDHTGRHRPSF